MVKKTSGEGRLVYVSVIARLVRAIQTMYALDHPVKPDDDKL
jgi:hypothetical protein